MIALFNSRGIVKRNLLTRNWVTTFEQLRTTDLLERTVTITVTTSRFY